MLNYQRVFFWKSHWTRPSQQVAAGLFQRARDVGVSGPFDDPPALRTPGPPEALRDGGARHTAGAGNGG